MNSNPFIADTRNLCKYFLFQTSLGMKNHYQNEFQNNNTMKALSAFLFGALVNHTVRMFKDMGMQDSLFPGVYAYLFCLTALHAIAGPPKEPPSSVN